MSFLTTIPARVAFRGGAAGRDRHLTDGAERGRRGTDDRHRSRGRRPGFGPAGGNLLDLRHSVPAARRRGSGHPAAVREHAGVELRHVHRRPRPPTRLAATPGDMINQRQRALRWTLREPPGTSRQPVQQHCQPFQHRWWELDLRRVRPARDGRWRSASALPTPVTPRLTLPAPPAPRTAGPTGPAGAGIGAMPVAGMARRPWSATCRCRRAGPQGHPGVEH